MEEIWWRQVTNARKFREEIQDEIFDLHSIVIQIPEKLQWYEEMQEMVREELHNREAERLLERIDDSGESMEPGELVLRRYFKEERQAAQQNPRSVSGRVPGYRAQHPVYLGVQSEL